MSLWQDIQPWIDPTTGLMTAPDGGQDNLVLMSAYLMRDITSTDNSAGVFQLGSDYGDFKKATRVAPGLFLRRPKDTDDNSIDNLIGACYLSHQSADEIRGRWNDYFSCFDVNHPTKIALNKNFYGRFIGLKAFIVAANGLKPWWVQRMLWALSVHFTQWTTSGASDLLLLSLQVDVMQKYCPRTCRWWKKVNPIYPLYVEYFGPNFPLTLSRKP